MAEQAVQVSSAAHLDARASGPLQLSLLAPEHTSDRCRFSAGSIQLLTVVAAARNRRIARTTAVERLWGDTEWNLGRRRLNSALHRLRAELTSAGADDRIWCSRDEIGLNLRDHDWIDLVEIERAFERAIVDDPLSIEEQRCLETAALALDQGTRLQSGSKSADWKLLLAARLENQAIALRSRLAATALDWKNPAAALRHCERALEMDPLREDLHRLSIRSHLALGDRASALRRLEELKLLLARELDASPMPETIRLIVPSELEPASNQTSAAATDTKSLAATLDQVRAQLVGLLNTVDDALTSLAE